MTTTDIVKQARDYARNLGGPPEDYLTWQLADEIERLRAVITRAKDALLDGQSTQRVHDLLVSALHE
jgi:hypothetical protein